MKELISFFEIPATDFPASVKFYEAILGEKLEVSDFGNEKMACFVRDGRTVGAVSCAKGFTPSADGVLIHFNVADIPDTLAKVTANGGSIHTPQTKIIAEGKGSFAVFVDPAGNHIGVYCD